MARGAKDWVASTGAAEVESDVGTYGQVEIGVTATLIKDTNLQRQAITVCNHSANDIYLGLDENVTASNGQLLPAYSYVAVIRWTGKIYGICPLGPVTASYVEFIFP